MTDNNIDDNIDKEMDTIKDDEPAIEDITGGHSVVKKEEPVVNKPIEKQKRPRTQKQIEAFQRCREQRANKIAEKKKLKETEKKEKKTPAKKQVEVKFIPDDEPKQEEQEIEDDGDDEDTQIDTSVNGFTLAVVVDNKNQVGSLQRRYATATDTNGVVVLKGEPSFSASEQILIDELAFYIRSNDLKAN